MSTYVAPRIVKDLESGGGGIKPALGGRYKSVFVPDVSDKTVYTNPRNNRTYTITSDMVPAYNSPDVFSVMSRRDKRAKTLLDSAFAADIGNDRTWYTPTNREMIALQAKDSTYPDKLLAHYVDSLKAIDKPRSDYIPTKDEVWRLHGTIDQNSIKEWLNTRYPVTTLPVHIPVGSVTMSIPRRRDGINIGLGTYRDKLGKATAKTLAEQASSGVTSNSATMLLNHPTWRSMLVNYLLHEGTHASFFDENSPVQIDVDRTNPYSGPRADMRGYEFLLPYLDLYSLRPTEVAQAQASYNRNKYALKRMIQKDPQKYLNAGFDVLELSRIQNMPDFYDVTPEGRKQFERDMQFFRESPAAARLLGPGARHVANVHQLQNVLGYLKNRKRKLDDAITTGTVWRFRPGSSPLDALQEQELVNYVLPRAQEAYNGALNYRFLGRNNPPYTGSYRHRSTQIG